MSFQRFYGKEGEYVSLERLIDWIRMDNHRLPDGRFVPLLIWGGMGVGKCIVKMTISIINGCPRTIEDVWASHADLNTLVSDGEGYWAQPNQELWVPSINHDGQIVLKRINRLYRQRVSEWGRCVQLDDGSAVTMTQQHRVLGLDDWQQDLQIGDRVCVPAHIPWQGQSVDTDLVTLLAWQLIEGSEETKRDSTYITQNNRDKLQRVRQAALAFGERYGVTFNSMPISQHSHRKAFCLTINSPAYRQWLTAHDYEWGHLSATKRIPDWIVNADQETLRVFLREFMAAESSLNANGNRLLEIPTASPLLMQQLIVMFRRFGIWLRWSERWKCATNGSKVKRPHYIGYIDGPSLHILRDKIGIADPAKTARLDAICQKTANSNTMGIPLSDLLIEAKQLTNRPRRRFDLPEVYFRGTQEGGSAVATQALDALTSFLDGSARTAFQASSFSQQHHPAAHQITDAFAQLDHTGLPVTHDRLRQRTDREVFYARVTAVEPVWIDDWVYDFEIEESHNYVAGGMLTHNTQQIKAYARARGLKQTTYQPAHDINGGDIVGQAYTDADSGLTKYALPAWLPTDNDPPGLLFIDEINRAPEVVLAGLMEPLGEGTIAQSGWTLPRDWNIVAAANPSELGYMVQQVDEAMVDRLLHYAPGWDAPGWAAWAHGAGLSDEIINFPLKHPALISSGEAQLPHELVEKLRATPRSLAYLNALFERGMNEGLLRVVTEGLLGREPAEAFRSGLNGEQPLSYEQIYQGQYDEILQGWSDTEALMNNSDDLIRASSERCIAHLVVQQPTSNDPGQEETARRVGRYFARLPSHLRDEALTSLSRSAAEWQPVVQASINVWLKHFARDQGP
jgi:hypothetical protein